MNLQDKCNILSKQLVKHAVILNEDCKHVGSISVRYTDDEIGLKHESGVVLHDSTTDLHMDYGTTVKGDSFTPFNLHKLFTPKGVECYDNQGRLIDANSAEVYAVNKALDTIRYKNRVFKVVWA